MSFNIYNLTSLNYDKCCLEHKERRSLAIGNYQLETANNYTKEANVTKQLAVTQPNIYYKDGYGWTSSNGCNVDTDSYFRNSDNLTNHRCIQQLQPRYALTVPYKGRGFINTNVNIEGNNTHIQKSCNTMQDIGVSRFTPLITSLQQEVQNPQHIIQENAKHDWVRGGIPSRQVIRNIDYNKVLSHKYK